MDRRAFAKGMVGAGLAGLGGAVGVAAWQAGPAGLDVDPPAGRYFAARRIGGPARRGVPLVPLVLDDGVFTVRPEPDVRPALSFCGVDVPDGDATLAYSGRSPPHMDPPWFVAKAGEPPRPEDFHGDGAGARVVWRGAELALVRLPFSEARFPGERDMFERDAETAPLDADDRALVLDRFLVRDGGSFYVATSAMCTHFCCHAGWKEATRLAASRNAEDKLFCTCHFAIFDLGQFVSYRLPAYPVDP